MPRRSAADVSRTRAAAVDTAVRTASVEGLEGLTIGRLAEDMHMSKSGLFGLFGSKLELQIATLEAGIEQFLLEVWRPVQDVPRRDCPACSRSAMPGSTSIVARLFRAAAS